MTYVSGSQGGQGLTQGWHGLKEKLIKKVKTLNKIEVRAYVTKEQRKITNHHGMQGALHGLEHPQAFICDGCWKSVGPPIPGYPPIGPPIPGYPPIIPGPIIPGPIIPGPIIPKKHALSDVFHERAE